MIPGSGLSLGGGDSYSLQYYCLENSEDREAWWATVLGVVKVADMTKQIPFSHIFLTSIWQLEKIVYSNVNIDNIERE